MEGISALLGFGLPVAVALVLAGFAADRLLRAAERRGLVLHPRRFGAVGIGNALLELHLALEPEKARIEVRLEEPEEEDEVGDGRTDAPAANVIPIDFVRRRRAGAPGRV